MTDIPMLLRSGHLFLEIAGGLWLLDTGAPIGFGEQTELELAGEHFELADDYLGMTADTLAGLVGEACAGLLGADVLNRFDMILDVPAGTATFSSDELRHAGRDVELDAFMGIPVVTAAIGNDACRMFLDTGAQISYLQHESLTSFPAAGSMTDFYPGFGEFETPTHEVAMTLAGLDFSVRCGTLPGLLGATLMMAGVAGIVGNEIMRDRAIGYFPRRGLLVL